MQRNFNMKTELKNKEELKTEQPEKFSEENLRRSNIYIDAFDYAISKDYKGKLTNQISVQVWLLLDKKEKLLRTQKWMEYKPDQAIVTFIAHDFCQAFFGDNWKYYLGNMVLSNDIMTYIEKFVKKNLQYAENPLPSDSHPIPSKSS